jgi:exopolyphosphatase/guanosine-5'-triphosphate,3'-diphosphate pyrophosphatase
VEVRWSTGRRISLPLGAVALTERHLPSDPIRSGEFRALVAEVRRTLARALRGAPRPRRLIAVGGTAATLAAMQSGLHRLDPARLHGARLTRSQLYVWLVVLSLLPVRRRLGLPGLERGRADIIVAGAAVLAGVLSALRVPYLTVSARGLRHGLALELARRGA